MPAPNRNTNHIYKSGDKSVMGNKPVMARTGKIGDPIMLDADPVNSPKNVSTDKYYRSGGLRRNAVATKVPVASQAAAKEHTSSVIQVKQSSAAIAARDAIIEQLQTHTGPVDVVVVDATAERAVRTQLLLAVGRSEIDEELLKRVRYSKAGRVSKVETATPPVPVLVDGFKDANASFGLPTPPSTHEYDGDQAKDVDIESFVRGDDEPADLSAKSVVEDTDDVVKTPAVQIETHNEIAVADDEVEALDDDTD